MKFEFGTLTLDLQSRVLSELEAEIAIEPKVFDLLAHLVQHRDRMVSKDELVEVVWDARFISDSAISSAIKFARKAVGDDGRAQHTIKTVFGRGFRFVAEVRTATDASDAGPQSVTDNTAPTDTSAKTNIPHNLGSFLGRDDELDLLRDLAIGKRLVSIIGPGGSGKTSLSIEVGRWAVAHFPGGVWFVELAASNETQILSAVLGALEGSAGAGPVNSARIYERIGTAPTLLILDNCEHLIDAVAVLVRELLGQLPELTILTTSREELDVLDENVVRISGLDCDTDTAPAVRLLQNRAAEVSAFVDTGEHAETFWKIAKRLEGLPLAIELAAPRLSSFSPPELLNALDDQLSVLASRRRHTSTRHSRMDDAIAWSVDLLEDRERNLLFALSIFAGAFTMDAAVAVFGSAQAWDVIHRLVQQSVVSYVPTKDASRYKLLEPIRQFCERQLEDVQVAKLAERHAEWFAAETTKNGKKLRGPLETEASRALTADWMDIARALAWGRINSRADIAIDPLLAVHIHLLWQLRIEGFAWLEAGIAACGLTDERQQDANLVRAMGSWSAGDLETSETLLEASVEGRAETVETEYFRFYQAFAREDFAKVCAAAEAAWAMAEPSDDIAWKTTTAAFRIIGRTMANPRDDKIGTLFDDLDDRLARHPWPSGRCAQLLAKVTYEFMTGNVVAGTELRHQLDRVADACNAPWFKITASGVGGQSEDAAEDAVSKVQRSAQNLKVAIGSGDLMQLPTMVRFAVMELWELGDAVAAAKLIGLVPEIRGLGEKGTMAPGFDQCVKQVREAFPVGQLKELLQTGSRLSFEDAVSVLETALKDAAANN